MNIVQRKLAMLEQSFIEQEETAKIKGYTTVPINNELREKVATLMKQIRQ